MLLHHEMDSPIFLKTPTLKKYLEEDRRFKQTMYYTLRDSSEVSVSPSLYAHQSVPGFSC